MLCFKKFYSDEILQLAILLSMLRVDRNNNNMGMDSQVIEVGGGGTYADSWDSGRAFFSRDNLRIHPKSLDSILLDYEERLFEDLNSLGRFGQRTSSPSDVTAYVGLANYSRSQMNDNTTDSSDDENDIFDEDNDDLNEISNNVNQLSVNDEEIEIPDALFMALSLSAPDSDDVSLPPWDLSIRNNLDDESTELTQEDMDLIEILWKQDVDMGFCMDKYRELVKSFENSNNNNNNCDSPIPSTSNASEPLSVEVPQQELILVKTEKLSPDSCKDFCKDDDSDTNNEEEDPWAGLSYTIDMETGEYILKTEDKDDSDDEEGAAGLLDHDFSLEEALKLVGLNELPEIAAVPDEAADLPEGAQCPDDDNKTNESVTTVDTVINRSELKEDKLSSTESKISTGDSSKVFPENETAEEGAVGGVLSDDEDETDYETLKILQDMLQTPPNQSFYGSRPFQGSYSRMPYTSRMNSTEQRWQDITNMLNMPDGNIPTSSHHGYPISHYHPQPTPYHNAYHLNSNPVLEHNTNNIYQHNVSNNNNGEVNGLKPQPIMHHHQQQNDLGHYSNIQGNSNFGSAVASSMNLMTNASEPMGSDTSGTSFKVENPQDLMMFCQNGNDSAGNNSNNDGFLSSILNEDDLFMDVAMNEGLSTMRMLESGATATGDSDSAVSSMGSERVPSLTSDTDWMETNSDSGHTAADHFMSDYHNNMKFRWGDYGYYRQHASYENNSSNGISRMPPVAQKKYQLFGKRLFQDQCQGSNANTNPKPFSSGDEPTTIKYEYNNVPPVVNSVVENDKNENNDNLNTAVVQNHYSTPTTYSPIDMCKEQIEEVKYSNTPDFPKVNTNSRSTPVEVASHNHTYHLPPEQSCLQQRPFTRDKKMNRRSEDENLSRDERRSRALNIPITVEDIVNLPMDEFNERLSKYDLSEPQLSLIRDIRRRGKNKVAAQNCRKRKLDQILSLADEVRRVRERKDDLLQERESLVNETIDVNNKISQLYQHIFQTMRDPEGRLYNADEWMLRENIDGSIILVQHHSNSHHDTTPILNHHNNFPYGTSRSSSNSLRNHHPHNLNSLSAPSTSSSPSSSSSSLASSSSLSSPLSSNPTSQTHSSSKKENEQSNVNGVLSHSISATQQTSSRHRKP